MYINFTEASKLDNNGQDVNIRSADTSKYNPKVVNTKEEEHIYKYIVTEKDEGATKLRFWRGNSSTLWNNSIILSYEDYSEGLYDNRARMAYDGETIAAPKDPEPLVYNEKPGVWDNHVKELQDASNAPKDYIDEKMDISGIILGDNIPDVVSKYLVETLLKIRENVNEHAKLIRQVALVIKKFCDTDTQAAIGAFLLNYVYDSEKIAYHSQPDTWQRAFGYNNFYDDVFRIGSYMDYDRADFTANNKKYALWFWKGDYWNLQSGAEMGLYYNPTILSEVPHYDAVDFEVPMTLSSYNYYSRNNIEHVFSWLPTTNQWWITGFNANLKNPNPNVMVSVGSVDLSSKTSIYEGLKNTKKNVLKDLTDDQYKLYKNNILLDDDTKTVWLIW